MVGTRRGRSAKVAVQPTESVPQNEPNSTKDSGDFEEGIVAPAKKGRGAKGKATPTAAVKMTKKVPAPPARATRSSRRAQVQPDSDEEEDKSQKVFSDDSSSEEDESPQKSTKGKGKQAIVQKKGIISLELIYALCF